LDDLENFGHVKPSVHHIEPCVDCYHA